MSLFGFFNKRPPSKNMAKNRLEMVLIQDRLNCSTQVLEMLKNDILKVIANYMEYDEQELQIQITQPNPAEEGGSPVLYANIPIKNLRKVGK